MAADEPPREEAEEERLERHGQRIREFLTEKWGSARPCPYCGNVEWAIDRTPVAIRRFRRGRSIPAFFVACTNCGAGVTIPAEQLGLAADFGLQARDE